MDIIRLRKAWMALTIAGVLTFAGMLGDMKMACASEQMEIEEHLFDRMHFGGFKFSEGLLLNNTFKNELEVRNEIVYVQNATETKPVAAGEENAETESINVGQLLEKEDVVTTMYANTPNQEYLRVRKSGSVDSEEIGMIPYGESIVAVGTEEGWTKVTFRGQNGYCYSKYLSENKPDPESTSTQIPYPMYEPEDISTQNNTEMPVEYQEPEAAETDPDTLQTNEENNQSLKSLGIFKLTFYCPCPKCCGKWAGGATASGKYPETGRTIAVDPSVIPLGSNVVINGHTYIAEDTGSGIEGNRIDVFMDSHQAALDRGVEYAEVFLL